VTLAIDGGPRVRTEPLPPWPFFADDEIAASADVLRSGKVNYWTGTEGRTFEREYAAYIGVEHAIAVANGSVSLELLLLGHGIGAGDEVITTPRTFMASASSIVMRGGTVVFADVDRDSGNISPETVAPLITKRTRAILPVHLAGWPAEMKGLMELAAAHDLVVIEDCAQAHGATYEGKRVGSLGHSASFSFCQDKILTTGGEGGLIATNDEAVWRRAWEFKDHGKSYEAVYEREHPPGYRWLIESFGTNMRMTEMQSAIGRCVLAKLDEWSARRAANAARLREGLGRYSALRIPEPGPHIGHANYKFYLYVEPHRLAAGWSRDRVMAAVNAEGIPCYVGSCSEIYLERAFDGTRPAERQPNAKELGETTLMLLIHPTCGETEMADTIRAFEKVMGRASA
jgi:hypothetical protein